MRLKSVQTRRRLKWPIPRNTRIVLEESQDNLCRAVQEMQLNSEVLAYFVSASVSKFLKTKTSIMAMHTSFNSSKIEILSVHFFVWMTNLFFSNFIFMLISGLTFTKFQNIYYYIVDYLQLWPPPFFRILSGGENACNPVTIF